MTTPIEIPCPIASKIAGVEAKLDSLGREIDEIGMPAAYDLKRRYDALRIEETALRRNFEESIGRGEPDAVRLEKIEALLRHIEDEEASVEREADFLHQSNPSTVILAAEAAARVVDLWHRAIKKVLGGSHPLGESVFVNHTHENLTRDFGLDSEADDKPAP